MRWSTGCVLMVFQLLVFMVTGPNKLVSYTIIFVSLFRLPNIITD